jgi:hypothetical protein
MMRVNGSSAALARGVTRAQVCSNTTAHVVVSSHAELKIDVDWLHIHDDKVWDKTVYDSGVLTLESKCMSL